jgi:hypothetical protein
MTAPGSSPHRRFPRNISGADISAEVIGGLILAGILAVAGAIWAGLNLTNDEGASPTSSSSLAPTSTLASTSSLAPTSTLAGLTFPETTGGETHTWTDYTTGGGEPGEVIPSRTTVAVRCRVEGLLLENGNAWWYRIASDPWSDGFYASADAFYNNGQTSGSLGPTPFVDESVPLC